MNLNEDIKWARDFLKICIDNDIEPALEGHEYLLVVPKMPPQEVQDKLREVIPPDIQYRYVEGPRLLTTNGLKGLFQQMAVKSALIEMKDHTMIFKIEGDAPALTDEDAQGIAFMKKVLEADPFVENWKVIVDNKTIYDSTIDKMLAMQVRPERDACPTKDDILDLRITLENCQDVNDFINSL
jgi:hypothetical protein